MRTSKFLLVLSSVAFSLGLTSANAEMGGLVVMVKGDAKLGTAALKPKTPLQKGQKIVLAKGAAVLYLSTDGRKVSLSGPVNHVVGAGGAVKGPSTAAKAMGLLSKGLSNMTDKERDFKNRAGIGGVKRSNAAENPLQITYPLNSALLETNPVIAWAGIPGAYKVSIQDDLGMEVFNQEVKGEKVAVPAGVTLEPEAVYTVAVEGPAGGDSIRKTSTFWLPPAAKAAEVKTAIGDLGKEFAQEPEARLMLEAALLHELELFHEEAGRLKQLLAKDPKDKASLLQLIEIQEKMGDEKELAASRAKLLEMSP